MAFKGNRVHYSNHKDVRNMSRNYQVIMIYCRLLIIGRSLFAGRSNARPSPLYKNGIGSNQFGSDICY